MWLQIRKPWSFRALLGLNFSATLSEAQGFLLALYSGSFLTNSGGLEPAPEAPTLVWPPLLPRRVNVDRDPSIFSPTGPAFALGETVLNGPLASWKEP